MRRGVARVRLCDRSGCPERWPCAVHGTLTISALTYEGHAHNAARLETVAPCMLCHHQACLPDCGGGLLLLPQRILRPGWTTDGEGYFHDGSNLMVHKSETRTGWVYGGNGEPWRQGFVSDPAFGTPNDAMIAAELHSARCRDTLVTR